jgi:pseudaminic acid biosynthesis-associated methylase
MQKLKSEPYSALASKPEMNKRIQDIFWVKDYANDYAFKNSEFDNELGRDAWAKMLAKTKLNDKSYLEVGCNIGRNLDQLKLLDPGLRASAIEINPQALAKAKSKHQLQSEFCGPAQDANFEVDTFELVFTCGVLIHISPDELGIIMQKMHAWSNKYILIAEYFNRTPVSIEYQGKTDLLFKRDFGGLFIDNFPAKLIDYGFLWGRIYDKAGFDDITWWLFEKEQP